VDPGCGICLIASQPRGSAAYKSSVARSAATEILTARFDERAAVATARSSQANCSASGPPPPLSHGIASRTIASAASAGRRLRSGSARVVSPYAVSFSPSWISSRASQSRTSPRAPGESDSSSSTCRRISIASPCARQ
jgi:hypothetical protein